MSLAGAALSLCLGLSPPCAARTAFESARTPTDCEEARALAETRLGAPLVAPSELEGDARCGFLADELRASCELSALPAGRGIQDARAMVAAIFERPEFAEARAPVAGRFELLFQRLRSWLFQTGQSHSAQSYAIATRYVVLLLAGAIALWGIVRAALRRLRSKAPRRVASSAPVPEALPLALPAEHLTRARALLDSEPRASMRESLLALLSLLESRSWARPDRATTNRELARTLESRGMPPLFQARAGPLLTAYDRAYYSLEPVDPSRAEAFLLEVSSLHTDVEREA